MPIHLSNFRSRRPLLASLVAVLVSAALLPCPARAQPSEFVRRQLDKADWHVETVAEGVVWRSAQLRLFGTPQSLNVLEVDLEMPGIVVDVVAADSGRVKTSDLARAADAVAAVNGSFFDVQTGVSAVYLQDEGRLAALAPKRVGGERAEAAIATEPDGDAAVILMQDRPDAQLPEYVDVLASGPLLVEDGRPADSAHDGFNITHHPRTVVGITPENHLLLVTVDGRSDQAAGMTVDELTWLMQALDASQALNLDGGGSTTMWIRDRGVVNYPSDNGAFDHDGERAVANAVVVRQAQ